MLAFDGVRAEESDSRATYQVISDGHKHTTQINCRPLLNWGAAEIYLYIFEHDLLLNDVYNTGQIELDVYYVPCLHSGGIIL